MKKFSTTALIIAFACFIAFSQSTNEEPKSNSVTLEFMDNSGSFIKKEFYDLPKVKSATCQALILTDIKTNKKIGCLRLKTVYYSSYTKSSDSYIGTLDYDELDACIQSLTYIKDNLLQAPTDTYTEVEFKTRDNLKIGAFCSKGKWDAFIYTKGYTSRSAEFFDADNITSLISVMEQAKTIIEEKTK